MTDRGQKNFQTMTSGSKFKGVFPVQIYVRIHSAPNYHKSSYNIAYNVISHPKGRG